MLIRRTAMTDPNEPLQFANYEDREAWRGHWTQFRSVPPFPEAELRRWCFEQTGVAADALPDVAKTALLRTLPERQFQPPSSWRVAARLLTNVQSGNALAAMTEPARSDAARRLSSEVEEFAAKYFALPPTAREARWQKLTAACCFAPALIARLNTLRGGLQVDAGPIANVPDDVNRFADYCRELYVLPLPERASRRQRVWESLRADLPRWRAAAKALRARTATVANLDTRLVVRLLNAGQFCVAKGPPDNFLQTAQPRRPPATGKRPLVSGGWAAFVMMFLLIRGCLALFNSSSPPRSPPAFHDIRARSDFETLPYRFNPGDPRNGSDINQVMQERANQGKPFDAKAIIDEAERRRRERNASAPFATPSAPGATRPPAPGNIVGPPTPPKRP